MQLPPFLTEWPYGEIMITGHRIGLFSVVVHHNEGESVEQLHERFPTLPPQLIEDVLAFYREHREEVNDYVRRFQEELDRQYASGKHIDWAELKRRWDARKQNNAG
jgi:uncharacterized protein (DUF433 family)